MLETPIFVLEDGLVLPGAPHRYNSNDLMLKRLATSTLTTTLENPRFRYSY